MSPSRPPRRGRAASSRAAGSPGTGRRTEGPCDQHGGLRRSPAAALRVCKGPGAASTPGGGWSPEEGQRANGPANPPRGEARPLRLPGAERATSQARLPEPPPARSLGSRRSAILSAPESLGNDNGVSISGRTSLAPATQITDYLHFSHLTCWSAAPTSRLGEAFDIRK